MFKAFLHNVYIYLNFAKEIIPKFDIQSEGKDMQCANCHFTLNL